MPPLLARTRILLAKVEATPGTAEALAAADGTTVAHDVQGPTRDSEQVDREQPGSLSPLPSVPGVAAARMSFSVHAYGGTTAPAWMQRLLPACGFGAATGQSFRPAGDVPQAGSPSARNVTLGVDIRGGGPNRRMAGCAGTFAATFRPGRPIEWAFEFAGLWIAPSTGAAAAPTYVTTPPIRSVGLAATIGAWSPVIRELVIRSGGDLQPREDANAAGGLAPFVLTNRRIVVELLVEETALATYNPHAVHADRTLAAFAMQAGASANGIQIAAPALQLAAPPAEQVDGNVKLARLTYVATANSAAGNDEMVITSI